MGIERQLREARPFTKSSGRFSAKSCASGNSGNSSSGCGGCNDSGGSDSGNCGDGDSASASPSGYMPKRPELRQSKSK